MFIRCVRQTPDLTRIKSLTRRTLSLATAKKQASLWTQRLALTSDEALRPWQGMSLTECEKQGGGFLVLPVGQGKTLIFEVLPLVMKSECAVLILPASLQEKTFADRRALRGKWRLPARPPRMISIEMLAREENAYLLDEINPDLVLIDEADILANFDAAACKRIWRFKQSHPRARLVAATGTPTRRSILGYWHLLRMALGDGAPVPETRADAELWAAALDDATPRQGFRPKCDALGHDLESARAWYLERLRSTPGVVIVDEDSAGSIPLSIAIELTPECRKLDEAFKFLREKWISPTGELVSDTFSLMRIESALGCGLATYWDPRPPQEWLDARSEVSKFIRRKIADSQRGKHPLDTDAQVMRAWPKAPAVTEWLRVRKSYDPLKHSKVKWLSDVTLQHCAEWLADPEPSVLWCGGVEFADRLARVTKLPYYGPKGREVRSGRELHAADPKRSMICSWHANYRGFNLQPWTRQGIIQPPQSAKRLEQILGRAHRALQTRPVRMTILATSGGTLDSFAAAISEAGFAKETAGLTQKVLRATIEPLPYPPATLRWQTKEE